MHEIEIDVVIRLNTETSHCFVLVELLFAPFEIVFSPIVLLSTNLSDLVMSGKGRSK
jgi:hypothetical protein